MSKCPIKSVFDILTNYMKKYVFKIPSDVSLMGFEKISRSLFIKYYLQAVQMFFLLVFCLFRTFLQKKEIKIEIWVKLTWSVNVLKKKQRWEGVSKYTTTISECFLKYTYHSLLLHFSCIFICAIFSSWFSYYL